MNSLRIALVVHGRFHIFDLARELIRAGHDVTLFTNYPKRVCERFGVPSGRVVNFLVHGIGSRGLGKLFPGGLAGCVEQWSNNAFGRWAAQAVLCRGPWDAVACMSGIAENLFIALEGTATLRVLERGSAHIREQKRILAEEEHSGGGRVEQPSDWIISREEREYELADLIHVQSPFARDTFLEAGVPSQKVDLLLLGVDVSAFKPAPGAIDSRCRRLAARDPLRVICAGSFSRQKGARCWLEMFDGPGPAGEFRFVGTVTRDAANIARSLAQRAEFVAKVPQSELPKEYAWADLFVLPTLQDGFAVVVAQALAAGLPVITTTSCGASALVENGLTGWIIPPGRPDLLAESICSADANRTELISAVRRLSDREFSRDWADVAREFVQSIRDRLVQPAC